MSLFSIFKSYEMINKILMSIKAASDMCQWEGFQRQTKAQITCKTTDNSSAIRCFYNQEPRYYNMNRHALGAAFASLDEIQRRISNKMQNVTPINSTIFL